MRTSEVSRSDRHILAVGGAFGYDNDAGGKFLKVMLRLTRKRKPRILFIGTASGDADYGRIWFYHHLSGVNCVPTVLRLFEPVPADLTSLILAQDAVFVGGGNSQAQLAVWRSFGLDAALKKGWECGIVLGGASAGGIVWFEHAISLTSVQNQTTLLAGIGLARGSVSPHYDSDPNRRPAHHKLIKDGLAADGYGIGEFAALHVRGDGFVRALSGANDSACYSIKSSGKAVVEEKLPSVVLR
jgi:Peptidase E